MKWTGYIFIFIALSGCSDLIDEEIPSSPSNLTGYYTHSYDSPRVHLSWDKHESEDIHEYHIYRSIDEGNTFDFLEKVSKNRLIYEDTSALWLQNHYYTIRAVDRAENLGLFSDSIYVYCYNPGGNWKINGYDSLFLCINPLTYATPEILRFASGNSLEVLGDTIYIMDLMETIIDSNTLSGKGLMHFSYLTLEESDDGVDTITHLNSHPSELCNINVSEISLGSISFDSEIHTQIFMNYNLTSCAGIQFIP